MARRWTLASSVVVDWSPWRRDRPSLPLSSLVVLPDFVSPAEASALSALCSGKLRRLSGRTYLSSHFDSVIHGYRECSVSAWTPFPSVSSSQAPPEDLPRTLLERLIRSEPDLTDPPRSWLPPHILDLENQESGIKAHVDHLTASGPVIMGICLGSPAVMRFRERDHDPDSYFSVLLEPRCAYIQR